MSPTATVSSLATRAGRVQSQIPGSRHLVVTPSGEEVTCRLLATGPLPLRLSIGDLVIFATPEGLSDGVILGAVDDTPPDETGHDATPDVPARLTLEAGTELTLRVGDGSITIRKDGKILIKGTDLVSHAKRMNRVKGGAVSIN